MQARSIQIPSILRQKLGNRFVNAFLYPNLKDDFIFVKLCVAPGFYRLYVYKVPVGNPKILFSDV